MTKKDIDEIRGLVQKSNKDAAALHGYTVWLQKDL